MRFRKEAVDKDPPAEPAGFRRNYTGLQDGAEPLAGTRPG